MKFNLHWKCSQKRIWTKSILFNSNTGFFFQSPFKKCGLPNSCEVIVETWCHIQQRIYPFNNGIYNCKYLLWWFEWFLIQNISDQQVHTENQGRFLHLCENKSVTGKTKWLNCLYELSCVNHSLRCVAGHWARCSVWGSKRPRICFRQKNCWIHLEDSGAEEQRR